ncbi:DUF726 domain-containing protein [Flavobacterium petrolei]|uniref:DUF726 domain-containing protein n=1 Tax=Flavobacterium petrolei TaxID=2259594 RepID=UPI0037563072
MIIDCISDYKTILNQNPKTNPLKEMFLSDSIDKFKITKHRDGNYPAIITISGWRSQDKDNRKDWEKSILRLYPDREWFHLEWNSNKLPIFDNGPKPNSPDMPKMPSTDTETKKVDNKFIKRLLRITTVIVASVVPVAPVVSVVFNSNNLLNNYWHRAVRNANETGNCLAKVLNACEKKDFILVGHSLGARVIFNCLSYLNQNTLYSNIIEIHLLGGAVGSNPKKWSKISLLVKNNIYNYFSDNDSVLKNAYRISMLSTQPIGLGEIVNKKVININSTRLIKRHIDYIPNFHLL